MFEIEQADRGGAPLFHRHHILRAIWLISESGCIGRKELSDNLDIGEGTTRKLFSYLEQNGWASSTRQGICLTEAGRGLLNGLGFAASSVSGGELTVDDCDFAIRISGFSSILEKGIEQRDAAIKAGAVGASTLVYRGKLEFSDGYAASDVDPEAVEGICRKFNPEQGDVIIIGSAREFSLAQDGAFAAAVLTINKME